jgi:hypothetical protein
MNIFLYKRQRLLLTLADALGGEVQATDFQKILFLYSQLKEENASFDFVPYRFGCFSFQSYADRNALLRKELLAPAEDGRWKLTAKGKSEVARQDRSVMQHFVERVVPQRGDKLIHKIYTSHPYYAIRSTIADRILDKAERKIVDQHENTDTSTALFTIGYEGDSIDGYLNRLIKNNVTALIDVRRNPLSRKTGFSKKQLGTYCSRVGIEYIHIPELGIPSHRRRELNSLADYQALFAEYKAEDLPQAKEFILKLDDLLKQHGRIALTCFEKEHICCHRHCVAEEMESILPNCPQTQHI